MSVMVLTEGEEQGRGVSLRVCTKGHRESVQGHRLVGTSDCALASRSPKTQMIYCFPSPRSIGCWL
jgi:hypothetical protein